MLPEAGLRKSENRSFGGGEAAGDAVVDVPADIKSRRSGTTGVCIDDGDGKGVGVSKAPAAAPWP